MDRSPKEIALHMVDLHHSVDNALKWAQEHRSANLAEGLHLRAEFWGDVECELLKLQDETRG